MIQTIGLLIALLLPIAACGGIAFKYAMEAHADFYRYEHHLERRVDLELSDNDWTPRQ